MVIFVSALEKSFVCHPWRTKKRKSKLEFVFSVQNINKKIARFWGWDYTSQLRPEVLPVKVDKVTYTCNPHNRTHYKQHSWVEAKLNNGDNLIIVIVGQQRQTKLRFLAKEALSYTKISNKWSMSNDHGSIEQSCWNPSPQLKMSFVIVLGQVALTLMDPQQHHGYKFALELNTEPTPKVEQGQYAINSIS